MMKIHVESTDRVTQLLTESGDRMLARIWNGRTDDGRPVTCYIARIDIGAQGDLPVLERALTEQRGIL